MIIVPTEKTFDWNRAPLALFCIVFINLAVFFVYQSSDGQKANAAVQRYLQVQYLEKEWPLYQTFLSENAENEALEAATAAYNQQNYPALAFQILLNQDFYAYLQREARNHFYDDFYGSWVHTRGEIQGKIASLSSNALGLKAKGFNGISLITYQFLHGGLMHLLGNMFFLVFCGFAVEAAIGHKKFVAFYLVSGAIGGLLHLLVDHENGAPLIGASASVSGVMAMYLAIFRLKKIEFFYWVFFLVGYFRAPALAILPFYLAKEIISFYTNEDSNVAFMAHVGGFISGAALILMALKWDKSLIDQEYIETDQSFDPQREALAELYDAMGRFRFARAKELVNQLIDEGKASFDLHLLRYNLQRMLPDDSYQDDLQALLKTRRLSPLEQNKLAVVWQENEDRAEEIDLNVLQNAGLELSNGSQLLMAESIFKIVHKRMAQTSPRSNLDTLGLFAKKLANGFADIKDYSRQAQYQKLAEEFLLQPHNVQG